LQHRRTIDGAGALTPINLMFLTWLAHHSGLPVRVGIPRSSKEREMAHRPSVPLAYDSNIERTTLASASLMTSAGGEVGVFLTKSYP
jgi:hypothetical protein